MFMHKKIIITLTLAFLLISGCSQQQIIATNKSYFSANNPSIWKVSTRNLWYRLKIGQELNEHYDHEELDNKKHWDQDHQKYINKITENSRPYIYHIINKLEANGLPSELALLPAIESSYKPFSYSSQGASGLWQFMPSTASSLNLKQDIWYDGRLDIVQSTDAAITYISYLYKRFDKNWLHALAAYNCGEGTVRRAIKRNKKMNRPIDFWSLDLPKETKSYVPRLLILSRIIANPKKYDVKLPILLNEPYFETVDLKSQININRAAKIAKISSYELKILNPGYKLGVTHPESPRNILLPIGEKNNFLISLDKTPKEEWSPIKRYKVKQGDTLSEIANVHKIPLKSLMSLNNITGHIIQVNQEIKIPGTCIDESYFKEKDTYTVVAGDTLWRISRNYKIPVKKISQWNNLNIDLPLKIGIKLKLKND
jgi:membrane-bound lytic murein transglycosylase D